MYTLIEANGAVIHFKDENDYMYVNIEGTVTPIMNAGGLTQCLDTVTTYTAYAAETLSGENRLLWVSTTDAVVVWVLDASWVRISSYPVYTKNSPEALQYEIDFGVDVHVPRVLSHNYLSLEVPAGASGIMMQMRREHAACPAFCSYWTMGTTNAQITTGFTIPVDRPVVQWFDPNSAKYINLWVDEANFQYEFISRASNKLAPLQLY